MPVFHLNMMVVQGFPSAEDIRSRIAEHGESADTSDFGVLEVLATDDTVEGTIYKRKSKSVRHVTEHKAIEVNDVDDVQPIQFKLWVRDGRLEVYTGSASTCQDLLDFFSEIDLQLTHASPSLDLLKAAAALRGRERFLIKSIEGKEYIGPGNAEGAFLAKFPDPDDAMEFLEGKFGAHALKVKVAFQASKRASISMMPNGCFVVSCNEDDAFMLLDTCRELCQIAVREDAE